MRKSRGKENSLYHSIKPVKQLLSSDWARMTQLVGNWGDGSEVKSTDCSSRGPEFKSKSPHGGSQPSVMRSDAPSSEVSEDSYSVVTYNK